jgi:hypothetical protein
MRTALLAVTTIAVLGLATGCGTVTSTHEGGTGGSPGTGGGTGGAPATGGSPGTGGAPATGGNGGASPGTGGHATGGVGGTGGTGGAGGAAGHAGSGGGGAGGKAGAGGSASGGSAGSGSHPECTQASDCVLQNDCCACAAVPKDQPITTCKVECVAAQCTTRQISASDVACIAGRCVLDVSCNPANVGCDIATPSCPAGSLPAVSGNCYTGACLPAAQCSDVASCDVCTAAGLACVTVENLGGPSHHCVSVPAACSAAPTCACLGVCSGAFQCSDPSSTKPSCQCPTCRTAQAR